MITCLTAAHDHLIRAFLDQTGVDAAGVSAG
jgi:hypothetical protein